MLFAEEQARLLLVLHVLFAAALVAVSTHLVVWLRHFPRGNYTRLRGVRTFAVVSAALFAITFTLGNLIYPVYKIRVRTEYLGSGGALIRDYQQRLRERQRVRDQYETVRAAHRDSDLPAKPAKPRVSNKKMAEIPLRGAKLVRWFDVKEHWVALGLALSVACMVILLVWDPRKHGGAIAPIVVAMAVLAAASAWLGALVGIVLSSYRSIGGF